MAEAQGRQMMYTEDELTLIKATFKNNEKLLKLMRKVFLPEYDPNAPLGQVIDLWLSLPVKEMSPEAAQINILARNSLIMHIENQLQVINVLATAEVETVEEARERVAKNSSK